MSKQYLLDNFEKYPYLPNPKGISKGNKIVGIFYFIVGIVIIIPVIIKMIA